MDEANVVDVVEAVAETCTCPSSPPMAGFPVGVLVGVGLTLGVGFLRGYLRSQGKTENEGPIDSQD